MSDAFAIGIAVSMLLLSGLCWMFGGMRARGRPIAQSEGVEKMAEKKPSSPPEAPALDMTSKRPAKLPSPPRLPTMRPPPSRAPDAEEPDSGRTADMRPAVPDPPGSQESASPGEAPPDPTLRPSAAVRACAPCRVVMPPTFVWRRRACVHGAASEEALVVPGSRHA